MQCGLTLLAHNQENKWYVDNGYSKHITRDKSKFLSLKEKDRGSNITFGQTLQQESREKE